MIDHSDLKSAINKIFTNSWDPGTICLQSSSIEP